MACKLDYLEFAKALCKECGDIFIEGYNKEKCIRAKSIADFVTDYDFKIENHANDRISKKYPDHIFIGEEMQNNQPFDFTDKPTWFMDPIDGTNNFISKFPFCCISLAVYQQKKPLIGIIYNPVLNQMFTAISEGGAFLNDERISVSKGKDLVSSLSIAGWGSDRNPENVRIKAENNMRLCGKSRGLRSIGSAAMSMCLIANGNADVYIEQGIRAWDMAAGVLLVQEAGGVVANLDGSDFDIMTHGVIAGSNPSIVQEVAQLTQVIDY